MSLSPRREKVCNDVQFLHSTGNSSMPQVLEDVYCGSSHRNISATLKICRFELLGQQFKIDTWPKTSNAHCWHCRLTFDTIPCSIPWKYDDGKKSFLLKGIFCSWSCAKRFCLDQRTYDSSTMVSNLRKLAICHFNHPANKTIIPAPPYTALNLFGGPMSVESYRQCLTTAVASESIDMPFYNFPLAISISKEHQMEGGGRIRDLKRPETQVSASTSLPNTTQTSLYSDFLNKHKAEAASSSGSSESSSRKRKNREKPIKKRAGSLAKFMRTKRKKKHL